MPSLDHDPNRPHPTHPADRPADPPASTPPIDFPTAQPICDTRLASKGLIVVWGSVDVCGTTGVPAVGMRRAFNPQDDAGVGLSVPDGVGGGRRWSAPPVDRVWPITTPRPARPRACSSAPAWPPSMAEQGSKSAQRSAKQHLFNLLGMCADPITGEALGRPPIRSRRIFAGTGCRTSPCDWARPQHRPDRATGRVTTPRERPNRGTNRTPVAGFDLTFSPSKSISTAWALADADTKETIAACHRRAIEVVLTYAEREVFHSRSGKNGVVQEDVEGVVATAFTHFDSRAGDPQLHDHVVVANRARSVSDGEWRTLDSRGLFKSVVMLGELHQGILADLLTKELGWGWDERSRRHSDQVRWEVTGVPETLLAEFSQRAAAIEERKEVLIPAFVAAHGRPPTTTEIIKLRQRATLETRPAKEHRPLGAMTEGWRQRAEHYVGSDPQAWVAGLSDRNDLPLLRAGDLADEILADAASVARSARSPSAGPPSRGPTSWPRSTASSTVSASPLPTTGLRWPSAPPIWPPGSHCSSRHLSCTSRRSACVGPMGPAGSGPRGTRSTPPPSSSTPRPACSRPGERSMAPAVCTGHVAAVTSVTLPGRRPSPVHRSGPRGGADRHLRAPARRVGRTGRHRQVDRYGRVTGRLGSRAWCGLGARSGPLGRGSRGAGRSAGDRDGEHRQVAP